MSRSAYIRLGGGLDLVTPPDQLAPGAALSCINYECPVTGGYRRIDGYAQLGPVVPGEGPLLGVVTFNDVVYAVRKDVGANTATLYRLDTANSAWVTVGTAGGLNNGRHEFVEGNAYATEAGRCLYGVGGGRPFEIDLNGTFTSLTAAPSGAKFIALHSEHLFLGFEAGSLQHSNIGDPTTWDASTGGAGEIGVGQRLAGLVPGTGGVLHVLCRDSIQTLYGTSSADWQLKVTVPNSGARPYSGQSLITPNFVAERGITSLAAVQEFGDFQPLYPGRLIEPIFTGDGLANRVVASGVSKGKAQYRLWFDNRTGVYMSRAGITTVKYPTQVAVAHSGELLDGTEHLLVGDDQGVVYRLDNGATTFNGTPIEAFLTLAFTDLGQPSMRKRFRRAFWDIRSGTDAQISVQPDYDYGRNETARPRREFLDYMLGGGLWGVDNWNEFVWSVPHLGQEPMNVAGTGTSINFAIYSKSAGSAHELLGYDLHFDLRRQRRG
ncbi:hypothetical protein DFO67_108144 [Modicisalibacter xianhensis]|uniref:Uncharacterized protein n=1 Tax=Modicisalibacter xianhensis TaxID=442341 RepID=A0A4R8FY84_9GAMM|nr:hypothetical protein [Halomonas xianhensis]TDX29100.1 hypothetical protein DFO67_108144 [Halomonas xianhensis]